MKYYKRIGNFEDNPKVELDKIYPENAEPNGSAFNMKKYHEYFPATYIEVTEKEYLQQELDAGKLVKGGYYTVKEYNNIFKHSGNNNAEYYTGSSCTVFCRNGGDFNSDNVTKNYRLATDDEIEWLEACNKADKFISREEFMKIREFVLPELWCIRGSKELAEYGKTELKNKSNCSLCYDAFYYHNIENSTKLERAAYPSRIPEGYTEITFEEFKQYVLNQKEEMNKNIIGYKLIKPEYKEAVKSLLDCVKSLLDCPKFDFENFEVKGTTLFTLALKELRDAGVLDIWFTPVYEPEYKVGDWVYIENVIGKGWLNDCNEKVVKIIEPLSVYAGGDKLFKIETPLGERGGLHAKFRKATKEEIEAVTVIRIKGYKAQANHAEGTITVGCQTFDYDDVRSVIKVINAGLKVEDSDQIKKLWDKIK